MHLSLEEIIENFNLEDVNLNRKQMETLINTFEPSTGELLYMDKKVKQYVVRHLFNKTQRERYYKKQGDYLFAEIVMSCIL